MMSGDSKPKEDDKKQLGRIALKRRPAAEVRARLEAERRAQAQAAAEPGAAARAAAQGRPATSEARPPLDERRHAELVALSERFGVPALDLLQVCLSTSDLDVVPHGVAEQHMLLPVLVRADRLFVAMKDPSQQDVIREIEFLSGKRVYAYAAKEDEVAQAIERAYACKRQGHSHYVGPACPEETLRKAGLAESTSGVAREPTPEPTAPLGAREALELPPFEPTLEDATPDHELERNRALPGNELFPADDLVLPLTVSAYPPRASSLPPALRRSAAEPVDEMSQLLAEMEEAFEQLTDEPSVVAPLPREEPEAGEKTILVVDDSAEVRDLLQRALTDEGYRVTLAETGLRALAAIKESRPDLIVLDAMLPEVHGFEIARRLRGSHRYGSIPIVMVSAVYKGWRFAEDLRESCGIQHYVEKPFRLAEIKRAVQRALRVEEPDGAEAGTPSHGSELAEQALKQGMEAFQRGEIDVAIEHLERGVAIDPLAFRLHFHLGLLYAKRGRVFEAIGALERAVEINSRHFAGVKNLAIMYHQAGFRHRAAELWERGLHLAPDVATRNAIKEHLVGLLS